MSVLRTLVIALLLAPTTLAAMSNTLYSTFASCTGRMSAEMEHAWLMHDPHAEEHEFRRAQFVDLLDAVVPDHLKRRALVLRIDAKHAHARLLTQATFSDDTVLAKWASKRAKAEILLCASLLLDS